MSDWTPSQDWRPGRFRVARPIDPMRVPDFLLKSSAFVVSLVSDGADNEYDLEASGFLVGVPSIVIKGNSFFYFVTAAHAINRIKAKAGIRVNLKRGGTEIVPVEKWYTHPTDIHADVAVTIFRNKYEEYDLQFLGESVFRTKEQMQKVDMGIGDEVWFPGLFTLSQQESDHRNLPILRMGNIAMLPDAPVPTEIGMMDAYLIEARSIGGLSGSPVFSRRTISMIWNDEMPNPKLPLKTLHGMTGEVHLIGMIHGHWDVKESEINQARITPTPRDSAQGVNVGIAIVIPIQKIVETINQPELAHRRAEEEAKWLSHFGARGD